jgi:hypothetical protein
MTLEELRKELADGYNACLESALNQNLDKRARDYYSGKADAIIITIGRIDTILNERVNA